MVPPPPSPRSRSRAGPALVAVAVLGGGAYAAWRWLAPSDGSSHDVVDVSEGAGPAELTGRQGDVVVEIDPYGTPPMSADELRAGLASRLSVRRLAVLKDVVARGAADREALPAIEAQLTDPDAVVALWAKGAWTRVTGDRRYVLALAQAAVDAPAFADPGAILRAVDPAGAEPLMAALAAVASHRAAGGDVPEGLEDAVARLARDPADGRSAIVARFAAATGASVAAWLPVVRALGPVPMPIVADVVARLGAAGEPERSVLLLFLAERRTDLSAAGRPLADLVAAKLDGAPTIEMARWWAVASKLPALDGPLVEVLLRRARSGNPVEAQRVLDVFGRVGAGARSQAPALLEVVRSLPEDGQVGAASALATLGGPDVVAWAAERLATAPAHERARWLDALRPSDDTTALVDPTRHLVRGSDAALAALAAAALVRWVGGAGPTGAEAAAEAVADARPTVRQAALAALGDAPAWPPAVVDAVVQAADDADPDVAAAAARAVAGAWRLGATGAALVPVLVRITAATSDRTADAGADARARALRSLASIAPTDARARAAFVAAANDPAADEATRQAAVYGLSRVGTPSAEERAALRARAADPATTALVAATLRRPGWRDPATSASPTR